MTLNIKNKLKNLNSNQNKTTDLKIKQENKDSGKKMNELYSLKT